jgi:hypothetical protein
MNAMIIFLIVKSFLPLILYLHVFLSAYLPAYLRPKFDGGSRLDSQNSQNVQKTRKKSRNIKHWTKKKQKKIASMICPGMIIKKKKKTACENKAKDSIF